MSDIKLKNRIELAEHFAKEGLNKGAEIGVADGRYAEILCLANEKIEYYGIDPWTPYKGNWRGKEYQNKAYEQAKHRLRTFVESVYSHRQHYLMQMTSLEAAPKFKDEELDFVFIDGDHRFNSVMLDILLWTPKVRKGGIVSGHDYYESRTVEVIPAVDLYTKMNGYKLNVIPRFDGGHKDDQAPCWWFRK